MNVPRSWRFPAEVPSHHKSLRIHPVSSSTEEAASPPLPSPSPKDAKNSSENHPLWLLRWLKNEAAGIDSEQLHNYWVLVMSHSIKTSPRTERHPHDDTLKSNPKVDSPSRLNCCRHHAGSWCISRATQAGLCIWRHQTKNTNCNFIFEIRRLPSQILNAGGTTTVRWSKTTQN